MSGSDERDDFRVLEALLFASAEPVEEATLATRLSAGSDVRQRLTALQDHYRDKGVNLFRTGDRWAFRTAPDLADRLKIEKTVKRKLSRAAVETLAIIAYHQPVTRAEIEEIRGVSQSKGTLDVLLEAGWVKPGRRRRTPGRPLTWLTTEAFLDHFGIEDLKTLPSLEELKAAGLLDSRPSQMAFRGEDDTLDALDAASAEDAGDDGDDDDDPAAAADLFEGSPPAQAALSDSDKS